MGVLEGRRALVTGGSRGIGRAVVERLARDGAHVVLSYRERRGDAEDVVAEVGSRGGRAVAVRADLSSVAAVRTLVTEAEETLGGGLDILVNNAGWAVSAPLDEVTEEDYDRIMAVNAKAPFFTMQYAARRMPSGGRIVNVSSLNTLLPAPGVSVYAGSKGALEQFTAVAAKELGPRGITVNAVLPGAVDTELLREANTTENLAMVVSMTPLGRLGRPADIADVVGFLCGPDARWITGRCLRADGGVM
ncbi:glucose 1-dehydrogenase [Streptomyces sp. NPDC059506]|uniref:glucose 1-dehydrogenase n=1 Tax=Streptomyces TaxID=1883 RepID=UPI0022AB3E2B|nr:glucose 1-dehydrogenase [Streptomyces sp. HB2AG]MCZ2527172.1 glucose 1-dehydrogenase [Streptomyces sp. HB2AG]